MAKANAVDEVNDMTKSLSVSNGILNSSNTNSDLTDAESDEVDTELGLGFDEAIKNKRGPAKKYQYLESFATYEDAVESLKHLDPLKEYK